MKRVWAVGAALLLGAGSCTTGTAENGGPATGAAGAGPQGWTARMQSDWYGATQGSRLMPWAWAKALERPGEAGAFMDQAWLERFRLLPRADSALPVGLAIDKQDDSKLTVTKLRWRSGQAKDEPWLGFNCAACHTAEITRNGQRLRVDGGPGLTDFQMLIEAFDAALVETRAQPAKWDRFARAVLGPQDAPAARDQLGKAVDALIAWNARIERANEADIRYGYARVDAFGHIFNKVALLAGPDAPDPNPSDAPVSYPFLWNTHQANRVQWNGIAENKLVGKFDYGALGRNTGEVLGVYGDVAIKPGGGLGGYASSVQVASINDLERVLSRLKPPKWPAEMLGAPDAALVAAGKPLFVKHCAACHTNLDRDDVTTKYKVVMSRLGGTRPIGTDPWMACNAFTYEARTGDMQGTTVGYLSLGGDAEKLPEVAPVANMLRTAVVGTLLGRKWEAVKTAGATWLGVPPRPLVFDPSVAAPRPDKASRLKRCMTEDNPLLAYRSRPLTGIWATAPYLHNGSVPTLGDLLLPPGERPKRFFVGTREYDPVKVGYVATASPDNSFEFDTLIEGNGNGGHDYGSAEMTAADRRALVEYMKTL